MATLLALSGRPIASLDEEECNRISLEKEFGETRVLDLGDLEKPGWHWVMR